MKDLAKKTYLKNKAKLEIGANIQFIEFDFDKFILYNSIMAGFVGLLFYFTNIPTDILLGASIGSIITLLVFYIKFGTN